MNGGGVSSSLRLVPFHGVGRQLCVHFSSFHSWSAFGCSGSPRLVHTVHTGIGLSGVKNLCPEFSFPAVRDAWLGYRLSHRNFTASNFFYSNRSHPCCVCIAFTLSEHNVLFHSSPSQDTVRIDGCIFITHNIWEFDHKESLPLLDLSLVSSP